MIDASRASGVDTLTGAGVRERVAEADVVIDVTNSRSGEPAKTLEFFTRSADNIVAAARQARVKHVVALSVVGVDQMIASPYMKAKLAQESIIGAGAVPHTIVRATQFFEFVGPMADALTVDGVAQLPDALMQPVAGDDLAAAIVTLAMGRPTNDVLEIAGPERRPIADFVAAHFRASGVVRDIHTAAEHRYFGARLAITTLVPGPGATLGRLPFDDWLARR